MSINFYVSCLSTCASRTNCTCELYGNYFAGVWGFLLWDEVPDLYNVIGFCIICWQFYYAVHWTQRQKNDSTLKYLDL